MESLEDRLKWNRNIAKTINPIDFYKEHHAGLTRGQLRERDPSLYQRLRKDGLLDNVPTKFNKA